MVCGPSLVGRGQAATIIGNCDAFSAERAWTGLEKELLFYSRNTLSNIDQGTAVWLHILF